MYTRIMENVCDLDDLHVNPVMESVVTSHCNKTAPTRSHRIEDL